MAITRSHSPMVIQQTNKKRQTRNIQPHSHDLPVPDHTTLWIKVYIGIVDDQTEDIQAGEITRVVRNLLEQVEDNVACVKGISSRVENVFYRLKRFFGCVRSKLESAHKVELLLWCKVLNIVGRTESYVLQMA